MAFFYIYKFAGGTLPQSVCESKNGSILHNVLDLIAEHKYDEAQYIWCKEVLDSDHRSLFRSLEEVFHNKVPNLSKITTETWLHCSSPLHPNAVAVKIQYPESIVAPVSCTFGQKEVDSWLFKNPKPCSEDIIPGQDAHSNRQSRRQVRFDIDASQEIDIHTCSGMRTSDKSKVTGMPQLLLIDYIQGSLIHYHQNQEQPPVQVPAGMISLSGTIYHLAALIYSNHNHFTCTVFISNGALYYNGVLSYSGKKTLHWLLPNKLKHPDNYYLVYAWYIKGTKDSPNPATSSAADTMETHVNKKGPIKHKSDATAGSG
ncbi:MAG: hypothetical protein BYD32DRAFT_465099 [Podila humilis]|nr:MAG: hypothetical protein BYD32DRAFT_465099 [Podila humilis]